MTAQVTDKLIAKAKELGLPPQTEDFLRQADLKAGDRIIWIDTTGTATFEVVAVGSCLAATIDDCPPASGQDQLVLLTQHPDSTTQGWLVVTARRIG